MDLYASFSSLFTLADLVGTIAFAMSGVMLASRLKMDMVGVVVLAFLPACGGGTVRDLLLGATPFWMEQPYYLYAVFFTAMVGQFTVVHYHESLPRWVLPTFDAIGLAVFTVAGIDKALLYGFGWEVSVTMGVLTGCGGGLLRDVVATERAGLLSTEVYATVSLAGGLLLFVMRKLELFNLGTMSFIACVFIFVFRMIAWHRNWHLPRVVLK
ncbi:trimeric intracellular cation channel family protein [Stomatohabitans albus]|uniref:trimeric intracellular cation channel family protein n=1 Tax=Stomatohabitans albus TaxID=3110766 RepID=UPI00300D5CE6